MSSIKEYLNYESKNQGYYKNHFANRDISILMQKIIFRQKNTKYLLWSLGPPPSGSIYNCKPHIHTVPKKDV